MLKLDFYTVILLNIAIMVNESIKYLISEILHAQIQLFMRVN